MEDKILEHTITVGRWREKLGIPPSKQTPFDCNVLISQPHAQSIPSPSLFSHPSLFIYINTSTLSFLCANTILSESTKAFSLRTLFDSPRTKKRKKKRPHLAVSAKISCCICIGCWLHIFPSLFFPERNHEFRDPSVFNTLPEVGVCTVIS